VVSNGLITKIVRLRITPANDMTRFHILLIVMSLSLPRDGEDLMSFQVTVSAIRTCQNQNKNP